MFQICDFFILLSLNEHKLINGLLGENKFFLASLKCYSQLFLILFHLLNEYFFVMQSLFQDPGLLALSPELKLCHNLVV